MLCCTLLVPLLTVELFDCLYRLKRLRDLLSYFIMGPISRDLTLSTLFGKM